MPGNPKRRERKLANQAAHRAKVKGISIDDAAREIEEEQGIVIRPQGPSPSHSEAAPVPGEDNRAKLEAARQEIATSQAEWLIGSPASIMQAYLDTDRDGEAFTPKVVDAFMHLIRCGIPVKSTNWGPGAAETCGLTPAQIWRRNTVDPEFERRYREARDASSEVLEDETRALLPTALARPDLLDGIKLVVGRLEWLSKVRNRERYSDKAAEAPQGSVTFNIGTLPQATANITKVEVMDVVAVEHEPITLKVA
jgi:hypothetical protein